MKMAYVTIEEAAKLTGKSTQSLYRHLKQGKVSRHHDGFDTAELMRVYGALRNTNVNFDKVSNESEFELSMLKRENELLRGNIEELRTDKQKLYEVIDNYQRQLPKPVTEQTTEQISTTEPMIVVPNTSTDPDEIVIKKTFSQRLKKFWKDTW